MASFLSRTYLAVYGFTTPFEQAGRATTPPVSISSFGNDIGQDTGLGFHQYKAFDPKQGSTGFRGQPSFQGSVNFQSGFLYNPDCIKFVQTKEDTDRPYAGNMQPDPFDLRDFFRQDFTIAGQCTATTVEGETIFSHSCLYNLCLGEGNCLTYYAGGPYLFDNADSTGEGFTDISDFQIPIVDSTDLTPYEKTVFDKGRTSDILPRTPPLAPPYAGTILGGIGIFNDNGNPIEGSVDVVTIAGRRRVKGIGYETVTVNGSQRQQPRIVDIAEQDRGAIVQQIFISANQELIDFDQTCTP